jgi:hypothetical protein
MAPYVDFVALIPGHGPRTQANWDPGAIGEVEEAVVVRDLCARLLTELTAVGVDAAIFDAPKDSPMTEPLRQYGRRVRAGLRAAVNEGAVSVLVLHVHYNAGKGTHSLAFFDPGSASCKTLAGALAAAMARWKPSKFTRAEPTTSSSGAANLTATTWRESAAFKGLRANCIVLEPWFVDAVGAKAEFTPERTSALARQLAGTIRG